MNRFLPKPESEVFCQSCGSDIVFDISDEEQRFCGCEDANMVASWAAKNGHIIHLSSSLNNLFVGKELTIQSSPKMNLYYEL